MLSCRFSGMHTRVATCHIFSSKFLLAAEHRCLFLSCLTFSYDKIDGAHEQVCKVRRDSGESRDFSTVQRSLASNPFFPNTSPSTYKQTTSKSRLFYCAKCSRCTAVEYSIVFDPKLKRGIKEFFWEGDRSDQSAWNEQLLGQQNHTVYDDQDSLRKISGLCCGATVWKQTGHFWFQSLQKLQKKPNKGMYIFFWMTPSYLKVSSNILRQFIDLCVVVGFDFLHHRDIFRRHETDCDSSLLAAE